MKRYKFRTYLVLTLLWLAMVLLQACLPGEASYAESNGVLALAHVVFPWLTHAVLRRAPHPLDPRLRRFFMVCRKDGEGVGFVRLMPGGGRNAYEIVYVIGEESLWGQGLGESAVRCAQAQAFLELRAERMVAKIMPQNRRSIRCVCACGFESAETGGELLRFEMTSAAYFQRLREA